MKTKIVNFLLYFVIGFIVIFYPLVIFVKIEERHIPFPLIVYHVLLGFLFSVAYVLFYLIHKNSARSPLYSYRVILRVLCIWTTVTILHLGFHWFRIYTTFNKPELISFMIIRNTMEAIERYYQDFGQIPAEQEGLNVLMVNPKRTNYLFQTELPLDAWGNELSYSVENGNPVLRSVGRDGKSGTKDDIVIQGLPPWDDDVFDDYQW